MLPHLYAVSVSSSRPRRFATASLAAALLLLGAACAAGDVDSDASPADAPDEVVANQITTNRVDARPAADQPRYSGPVLSPIGDDKLLSDRMPVPKDTTPPGFVIISPQPGSIVPGAFNVFEGITEPGATVAAGHLTAVAGEDGRWSLILLLVEGQNAPLLTSTDVAGNATEKEVTVHFEKPKPVDLKPHTKSEAGPEKHAVKDFTAWTKFGICTTEPVEKTGGEGANGSDVLTKFKGTGVPGTAVTVTSPYGDGITEVGDDGYWWVKIEFAHGAAEDTFTAVVRNGDHIASFRCGAI